jgi:AsmA protein
LSLFGEKRRKLAFLAAGLLLVTAFGFVSWPLSPVTLERLLAGALARGGITVKITENCSFALLPWPHLVARGVTVDYREGAVTAKVGSAVIVLDVPSLLGGTIAPASVALQGATIRAEAGVQTPLDFLRGLIGFGRANAFFPGLQSLSVESARLSIRSADPENGLVENLTGTWRPGHDTHPFTLTFGGTWRGESIETSASGPAAHGALTAIPAAINFVSRPITIRFSGDVAGGDDPKVNGQISVVSANVDALARWLALKDSVPPRVDSLAVEGAITASNRDISLSPARITLNGDVLDGIVSARHDGARPSVTATLAANQLDLTDQLALLAPRLAQDRSWSQERFDITAFDFADLDLRISAQRLMVATVALERTAMSVMLRNRRFEISIAEAMIGGGPAKGRLVINPGPNGIEMKANFTAENMNSDAISGRSFGAKRVSGMSTASLMLESSGHSPASMARNAEGRAMLSLKNGELLGIDLERYLLRIERRSLLGALDVPGGKTSFDLLTLNARISAGNVVLTEGTLRSPAVAGEMHGRSDAPGRLLDFTGTISTAEQPGRQQTVLPFTVRGTWDSPRVNANVDEVKRRS